MVNNQLGEIGMANDDPNLKEWMIQIERRLSRLEAYMKVLGGSVSILLPIILYLVVQILLKL